MSFFSLPDEMVSAMREFEKNWSRLDSELSATMPKEMAGAVNLLAHPMAGFAAASAIGFGLASQAVGIWMGSVAGTFEAAWRMSLLTGDGLAEQPKPSKASARAKIATETLIADAKSLALEVADTDKVKVAAATKPPKPAAQRKAAAASAAPAVAEASAPDTGMAKPAAIEKPASPDDLKVISGIGPKLEQVLNGMGVWTLAQIAAWTPAEVAWVDDQLGFSGRIGRDDWIGQAKKLAGAK